MTDRALLDSTLSRCSVDRVASLDDRECSNARRAVERLWRQQEQEKQEAREREFERKREALRAQADREQALLEEQRKIREALQREEEIYGGVSFGGASLAEPGTSPSADPHALPEEEGASQPGDGESGLQQAGAQGGSDDASQSPVEPADPLQAVEEELAKRREAAEQTGDR
jgi:hypothetical protein